MRNKNILLVYKKSAYAMDFLEKNNHLLKDRALMQAIDIARYRRAHERHQETLSYVEDLLMKKDFHVEKCWRGQKPEDLKHVGMILTVGGDGTFLQAARQATHQLVFGVNSDPDWSVGQFCAADIKQFERVLDDVISGKRKPRLVRRMILAVNNLKVPVLNDILLAHNNPGAMSRYLLKINKEAMESHRSSGIWIATASGSSSAIKSAGGKILPTESSQWQYMPRELYPFKGECYHLRGGILKETDKIHLQSIMNDGFVFVDGSHYKIPLDFGQKISLKLDPKPLKIV